MTKKISTPIALAIVIVLAVIAGTGILMASQKLEVKTVEIPILVSVPTNTRETPEILPQSSPKTIKSLEDIVLIKGKNFDRNQWDLSSIAIDNWENTKIIAVNKNTKEQKTIIESTGDLRAYIGKKFNSDKLAVEYGVLDLSGSDSQGEELYFDLGYEGPLNVFGLDIKTLVLREIKNAESRTFVSSALGDKRIIMDEAYPSGGIYLACLKENTKELLATPKNGETLQEYPPEMDTHFKVKWLDEQTIQYNIYNLKCIVSGPEDYSCYKIANTLLEARVSKVPNCGS